MSMIDSKSGATISTDAATIDLTTLTVEKVQEGFRLGAFTAESLAEACFRQTDTFNGHYNALIFRNEAALADARATSRCRPRRRSSMTVPLKN